MKPVKIGLLGLGTVGGGTATVLLRNAEEIPRIRGKAFLEKTFIPRTIRDWNALSQEDKDVESSDTFASRISRRLSVPKWFLHGERFVFICHAKLRMMCSPLNDHLFSHIHVIESPTCLCGYRRENNKHYLLDCPLYANEREVMLAELSSLNFRPTTKNLLFGNNDYSDEINSKAFKIIQ